MLSLRRHLEDFGLLHCLEILSNCRMSVLRVLDLLRDFRNLDDLLHHLWFLHVDDLFNDSFHVYVPLERSQPPSGCCEQLQRSASPCDSTRALVMICATSTIFSTTRSEARSSGIALTHAAGESSRRSALLCVANIDLLDHFLRFFIREFLTHIFHHVTLIRCTIWGCRLNSLSDGMVIFLLCDLNRASFSVSHHLVNATVVQLCEEVHHGRQLGVHVRVSLLTCAELCSRLQLCSTARSLHSDPSLSVSLASSS